MLDGKLKHFVQMLQMYTVKSICKSVLFYKGKNVVTNLLLFRIKDCLPCLFHGFRNKHFNKISLDSMLYLHNELYKF